MKRLAKNAKSAFRTGRGELGESGASAGSASFSDDPEFSLSARSVSCCLTEAICDPISAWFSGVSDAWSSASCFWSTSRARFRSCCSARRLVARNVVATVLAIAAAPCAVSSVATTLIRFASWSTVAFTLSRSEPTVSPSSPFFTAARSRGRVVSRALTVWRSR
jgi:hypothetical protein